MAFQNIKVRHQFMKRVGCMWLDDFELLEPDIWPDFHLGWFDPRRLPELVKFCRENPEYHVISSVTPDLKINGVVRRVLDYYLGYGDSSPTLIHDPGDVLDASYLQFLNSKLSNRRA